ncbi:ATP dependent DNA ligase [Mycolicibacterium insubricum]|uniref:ATP dependent DNA ligase n=1 Tax=Mycolicibacterium insubricum TaxID=444597 RepID=UPI003908AC3B
MPSTGGLTYLGKVGTGFDDAELRRLTTLLAEHRSGESPFSGPAVSSPGGRGALRAPRTSSAGSSSRQ